MLKVSDLCKAHDAEPLFADVSFVLNDGDRVGLVGPNGAGKSTLFRIIAGEEDADAGSVLLGSEDRVGYLQQESTSLELSLGEHLRRALGEVHVAECEMRELEARLAAGETSRAVLRRYGDVQERFAALDGWAIDDVIAAGRQRLRIADLPLETTLGSLSGGQQARIMIAGALLREPTILLLDEPTNHLDLEGIAWLEEFVREFPGVVFTISHDRRYLDSCVSRMFELDGISERMQRYEGGYSSYREQKRQRWERWLLDFESQEKYRKRLEADIARTKWQAHGVESSTRNDQARRLAAKVAKKAKSRERMLDRQVKMASWVARPQTRPKITIRFTGETTAGRSVLRLSKLRHAYGEREVLHDVSLDLRGRDRLAIVGVNGSGKSTLLRLAHERLSATTSMATGYLPQDHSGFPMRQSVLDFFRSQVVMHEDEARTFLDRFLFEQHQMRQPLRSLSSGERTRLALGALVCSNAQCLLMDEPTNHLDFDSLDVVTDALRSYQGTLVVVSHDRQFMRDVRLTAVLALRDGRVDERWGNELADTLVGVGAA
jgi:ATPase subunit of ABC transporter with duplicated ATPase domains